MMKVVLYCIVSYLVMANMQHFSNNENKPVIYSLHFDNSLYDFEIASL